ncbi:MAG TPA: hypothetical protein VFF98_10980 [Novosphingobium sp.]|nr:hypothetical protein [Novosphingobium sp.]HZV10538.1 hypothetical protein [Novosphingobium sp.]
MRRALVLVDDAARHPFRQGLPLHVRRMSTGRAPALWWPAVQGLRGARALREFLMAYCACFVAVCVFIG